MASDHEEEQPIDLSSKLPVKETKVTKALPPLIPIHEIRRRFEGGILPKRVTTHGVIFTDQTEGSSREPPCPINQSCVENPSTPERINFNEDLSSFSGSLIDSENETRLAKWNPSYYDKLLNPYKIQNNMKEETSFLSPLSEKEDKFSMDDVSPSCSSDNSSGEEPYRKSLRPLTGKHVRPGTGARAETLLTLRRKIQQRQQKGGVI